MDLGILALICAAGLVGPALSLATRGALPAIDLRLSVTVLASAQMGVPAAARPRTQPR